MLGITHHFLSVLLEAIIKQSYQWAIALIFAMSETGQNQESDGLLNFPHSSTNGYNSMRQQRALSQFDNNNSCTSMSQSDFETLSAELTRQQYEQRQRSRSGSDSSLPHTTDARMDLNDDIEKQSRRTLYGTLPFMSAFGMHAKEAKLKKIISSVSMQSLLAAEAQVYLNHKKVFTLP